MKVQPIDIQPPEPTPCEAYEAEDGVCATCGFEAWEHITFPRTGAFNFYPREVISAHLQPVQVFFVNEDGTRGEEITPDDGWTAENTADQMEALHDVSDDNVVPMELDFDGPPIAVRMVWDALNLWWASHDCWQKGPGDTWLTQEDITKRGDALRTYIELCTDQQLESFFEKQDHRPCNLCGDRGCRPVTPEEAEAWGAEWIPLDVWGGDRYLGLEPSQRPPCNSHHMSEYSDDPEDFSRSMGLPLRGALPGWMSPLSPPFGGSEFDDVITKEAIKRWGHRHPSGYWFSIPADRLDEAYEPIHYR